MPPASSSCCPSASRRPARTRSCSSTPAVASGKGRPKNYIPEEDIRPIAAAFLKGEPVEGEVAVITREQAAEADYNLSPSRWVGQADSIEEADLQDIMERFDAITAEEAASLS